jgi:hypothetical protein
MAAVRNNHLPDLPGPRQRNPRLPGPDPDAADRTVHIQIGRPAEFSPRPVPRPGRIPNQCGRDNGNRPARSRQPVAVVAVGIVVPLAVLAACFCLPRREHSHPTKPPAAPQPVVAVAPAPVIPEPDWNRPVAEPGGAPAEHQVLVVARNGEPAPEQQAKPPEADPARPQPPMPPARVEKPLAAVALPGRADEPLLPAAAAPQPEKAAVREGCPKLPGGDYGTAVRFAKDPTEAAKLATEDHKLMVIFTISGNFEDSKFT